jgi:hypothetical protein
MSSRLPFLIAGVAFFTLHIGFAQSRAMSAPRIILAGDAFVIQTTGAGKAALFIVGPDQVLRRDVQLGEAATFAARSLYNAGHYLLVLKSESSAESDTLDVLPAKKLTELSFLAKPSRLPVGLHDGITGAVYIFDAYANLITIPTPVSFELTAPSGAVQRRTVEAHDGAAWTGMDSTAQQGSDKFVARAGDISSTRIVAQVPGDPCGLKMTARQSGERIELSTDPVRDCNGNAVPDGTIVTFTESYRGGQSTVDVPLKRGIAEVQLPDHSGATISVASGVVMGNQIGWEK